MTNFSSILVVPFCSCFYGYLIESTEKVEKCIGCSSKPDIVGNVALFFGIPFPAFLHAHGALASCYHREP